MMEVMLGLVVLACLTGFLWLVGLAIDGVSGDWSLSFWEVVSKGAQGVALVFLVGTVAFLIGAFIKAVL